MVERQPPKGWLQLVAVLDRTVLVDGRGDVLRQGFDRTGSRLVPLGLRVAGVDQQAVRPAVELGRITQASDVAPDVEEGLLGGILGQVLVTKDAVGHAEQPRMVSEGQ